MSRPIIRIHNGDTDEIIDREMTDEEFAQYQTDVSESLAFSEQKTAAAAAKSALLDRLGITAEEAALLLQ